MIGTRVGKAKKTKTIKTKTKCLWRDDDRSGAQSNTQHLQSVSGQTLLPHPPKAKNGNTF